MPDDAPAPPPLETPLPSPPLPAEPAPPPVPSVEPGEPMEPEDERDGLERELDELFG